MIHGTPHYLYALPCGHTVRSYTLAMQSEDGWVWLHCAACGPVCLTLDETITAETPPHRINGQRMSDSAISQRLDEAIIRERILHILDASNGLATAREITMACGKLSAGKISAARVWWQQQHGNDEMESAA